tara:strand:- start:314 stop:1240 length:927 start_codon:yes stop_codon:yes gene_type:complete
MQDMKLLLEGWRSYSSLVEQEKEFGSVFLFENKKAVKKEFSDLLYEHKIGKLSDKALYEAWHKSLIYEQELLEKELNEVDWAARAAEIEAGDVETDKYDAEGKPKPIMDRAMQKLKDFTLEKSVQLFQLAQRGIEMAVKAASGLIRAVSKFKEKHPVVFKVVVVLALTAGVFALMTALEGSQAQAAIKAPGAVEGGMKPGAAGEISDTAYEALRGLVHQTKDKSLGGTGIELRTKAMRLIDAAQQAGEVVDFSTLKTEAGQLANESLRTLDGLVKLAKKGDPQAGQWINELVETGKSVIYKMGNVPTR